MTRVAIFGAGAVGGHIAVRLAQAGIDVSVIARGAHLQALRQDGLRLVTPDSTQHVRVLASDRSTDLGQHDLVIVTLKAHSLSDAAAQFAPLMGASTPIVFAVNGIPWWYRGRQAAGTPLTSRLDPDGMLARHVPYDRVLGCVLRSPNEIVAPGIIRTSTPTHRYAIGEPDGGISARVEGVVTLLRQGLPGACATDDIRGEVWQKLAVNLPSSLLSTLTLSTSSDLFADPATRNLYERVGIELESVANACGARSRFDLHAQIQAAGARRHAPSILQDLLAERRLETDAQIFAVQDIAREKGVHTPLIDVLATLLDHRARLAERQAAF